MIRLVLAFLLLPLAVLAQSAPTMRAGSLIFDRQNPRAVQSGEIGQLWAPGYQPLASEWNALLASKQDLGDAVHVSFYGPAGDRATDDTAKLQAALNARAAAGGGTVMLGQTGYLVDSADLVIPPRVKLDCAGGFFGEQAPTENWKAVPCSLIVNPLYSVTLGAHSKMSNVSVVQKNLTAPTSMRTAVQAIAGFSGTGIKVSGIDVHLTDIMVVGFANCLVDNGSERLVVTDLSGDCTNGYSSNNSHDISNFYRAEFWNFAVGSGNYISWADNGTYAITGFANNGSGNIRVAFTPGAEAPVTGDLVAFFGMKGLPFSARRRVNVTVVDATHMDLPIPYPANFSLGGTTVSGSNVISNVSDLSGIGVGMALTANGAFPTGTTIVDAALSGGSPGVATLTMSANATATVTTGGSFTFSPLSQSGGTGKIDITYRDGKGFSWTNGERNSCDHCFEYGHRIGFYIGAGALWTELTAPASDMAETEDGNAFAYLIDAGSANSMVSNVFASSHGHALYVASSGGPGHTFNGGSFNQAAAGVWVPTLQFISGNVSLNGTSLGKLAIPGNPLGNPSIVVGGGNTDKVILVGNDFNGAAINGQDAGAAARVISVGNNISGGP